MRGGCVLASQEWRVIYSSSQRHQSSSTGSPMSEHQKPESHGDRKPNRLIHEQSPYLRQHAYNPVDWFPWGEEALQRARTENRPILLSIGYSACHWCHVMER